MEDFRTLVDLASERLGGAVLAANDEFFAPRENLIRDARPVFREAEYTERGKWMDGWETRRRREPGHDWAVVRLGLPGVIRGLVVDTAHFKGNFPESCSVEACEATGYPDAARLLGGSAGWTEILPRTPLQGDCENAFAIRSGSRASVDAPVRAVLVCQPSAAGVGRCSACTGGRLAVAIRSACSFTVCSAA